MVWYKNKQRDVRPVNPGDEDYDPEHSHVLIKMDDGTEELVDAALLGSGDLPEAPPVTRKAPPTEKPAHK